MLSMQFLCELLGAHDDFSDGSESISVDSEPSAEDLCDILTVDYLSATKEGQHKDQEPESQTTFDDVESITYKTDPTNGNNPICDRCQQGPPNLEQILQRHSRRGRSARPALCDLCNRCFSLKRSLYRHIRTYHNPDLPFQCQGCSCRFENRIPKPHYRKCVNRDGDKVYNGNAISREMKHHKCHSVETKPSEPRRRTKQKEFQCIHCKSMVSSYKSLKKHMNDEDKTVVDAIVCVACDREFPSRRCLNVHMDSVHISMRKQCCSLCEMQFIKWKHWNSHRRKVHSIFDCPKCNQTFVTEQILRTHLKQHLKGGFWLEVFAASKTENRPEQAKNYNLDSQDI